MNIEVKVDEVTLDTVIHQTDDGPYLVGDAVAARIVQRIAGDRDAWDSVSERVRKIRDEEVRAVVRPLIEEALTAPLVPTNSYGEAIGSATTLSALIVAEARKAFSVKADAYGSNQTVIQKLVADTVREALGKEIITEVKAARDLVSDGIGVAVANAVREGLRAK